MGRVRELVKILVCGDREWKDANFMRETIIDVIADSSLLFTYPEDFKFTLIHGDASGADKMSEIVTNDFSARADVLRFPAKWEEHGHAAGPIRNQQMLDESKPDLVLAFHNDIGKKHCGTFDMIRKANKAGVEVRLFSTGSVME